MVQLYFFNRSTIVPTLIENSNILVQIQHTYIHTDTPSKPVTGKPLKNKITNYFSTSIQILTCSLTFHQKIFTNDASNEGSKF